MFYTVSPESSVRITYLLTVDQANPTTGNNFSKHLTILHGDTTRNSGILLNPQWALMYQDANVNVPRFKDAQKVRMTLACSCFPC